VAQASTPASSGGVERLLQIAPGVGITAALNFVPAREFLFQIRLESGGRHTDARQQFRHEAFALAEQREQQMPPSIS